MYMLQTSVRAKNIRRARKCILSRAPRAGVACQALAELTHPEGQTKISDSPHCEKKIRHAPKFVCRSAKDLLSTKGSAPVRESPSEECRVVRVFFGRCRCSGSYCQGTHQQRRSDRRRSCLKAQRWMRLGSTRSSSWRECQQAAHGTRGSSSGNRQMDQ